MKYLNKIASAFCVAALGVMALTSCEGGDLYNVSSPDWRQAKIDSIKAANQGGTVVIEGLEEDVYTVGATDYSTGWWAVFSKYYQVPDGEKWVAQFNLNINPAATNTYKNYAMIITNDEDRGAGNYKEYGAIRFDNQPSGNSEWGDYIDRSLVSSTLTFETDTDAGVDKLGGKVTLTVDRTSGGLIVTMTNGTVTKTYKQTSPLPNLNEDEANTNIRCFLVPEGSYINWLGSTIEPIGGFTTAEDKQPESIVLAGVPEEVDLGTPIEDVVANITGTVFFTGSPDGKAVTAADLSFTVVPDLTTLGEKTLVAVYNKTFKGEGAVNPVVAVTKFNVVPVIESIAITKAQSFSTYYLFKNEYTAGIDRLLFFNPAGLQVTATYADGSKAVIDNNKLSFSTIPGAEGTYSVEVKTMNGCTATIDGIKVVETSDASTVHPKPTVLGLEDNTGAWWTYFSDDMKVAAGKTVKIDFTNYGGGSNWNNWNVVLRKSDLTEYGVVRADNFGWGAGYDGNPLLVTSGGQSDWGAWLAAMSAAEVTMYITNIGNGMVDILAVMNGSDGNTYFQYYLGIAVSDVNDMNFSFVIDGDHLVFK